MAGPSILVRFLADTKEFRQGINDVEGSAKGFTDKLGGVAKAVATAFVAKKVIDFAKDSIAAAQDLNAGLSRTNTIFGESAGIVEDWSKRSATALRMPQAEALAAANTLGKTLVGSFGMSGKAAAEMSVGVVNLAKDMAVFNRVPFEEALDKVTAGLNGQTRGLKTLGVNMDAAEIKAKALQLGLIKQGETLDGSAKAQATYALLLEKTALQQGATEKSAGSLKAQQEKLSAEWKNTQATVGQQLLPVLTEFARIASDILVPAIRTLASIFRALGPALAPIAVGIIALAAAIKIATVAQNLFNISLLANPITWIVIAIVALVAVIVYLATKTQFFQTVWSAVWGGIVTAFNAVKDALVTAWNTVVSAISTAISWVVGFVSANWPLLVGIILGPIGIIVALIYTFRSQIVSAIQSALDFVKSIWSAGWAAVSGIVSGAVGAIVGAVQGIVNGVRSAISAVTEALAAPFRAGAAIVVGIVNGLKATVESILGGIKGAVNGVLGTIRGALSAVGGIGFSISVPSWIPGIGGKGWDFRFPDFSGRIPRLAAGGVIDWPTVALLGEQRGVREVVSPEPLLREIVRTEGGRDGPAVNIEHVELAETIDLDLFLKRVGWAVRTGAV